MKNFRGPDGSVTDVIVNIRSSEPNEYLLDPHFEHEKLMIEKYHSEEKLFPAKLSRPRMHAVYPLKRIFDIITTSHDHGALWVGAPAGSGKTTTINSYLTHCDLPCLWYTIDEGDGDIATFFYYLRNATEILFSRSADLPPFLTPDHFPNISLFAKRFFEKFFGLFSIPLAVVLDDYHEVKEEALLHEVMCNAISQLPAHIKLYILSRTEPPPELVRQRANNRLSLLGWKDLRLELNETRRIARRVVNFDLPEEVFVELHTKTDGWVAGLLLLLKRGEFDGIAPQLLSGQPPQEIFDYLSEESFKKLTPEIQAMLLRFAFLQQITLDGAGSVTQCGDTAKLLQRLQRNNTFLNLLAGEQIAYRFHPLMRRFLQMKARQVLSAEKFKQLLQQSAAITAAEGDMESAVRLYTEAEAIPAAVELLLSRAADFARQGRFNTLEKLITALPPAVYEKDPWLIYWRAACRLPFAVGIGQDLSQSSAPRRLLMRALSLFEERGNPVGSYLAIAGIIESIWMEMDDFTLLDPWIGKYDELRQRWNPFEAPEAILWLTPAILSALQVRNPNHPDFSQWFDAGMQILSNPTEASVAIRTHIPIVFQLLSLGDLITAGSLINRYRTIFDENISPKGALVFQYENAYYFWLTGRYDDCLAATNSAFAIARKYGLRMMWAQVHGAVASMNLGDMKLCKRFLLRTERFISTYGAWKQTLFQTVAGWVAMARKDFQGAEKHALAGLAAGEKAGNPSTLPIQYLHCALIYFFKGEKKRSRLYLQKSLEDCRRLRMRQIEFGCHLVRAEFALEEDDEQLARALADAFELGSRYNYMMTYFWRFDVMARLCTEALKRNIRTDYARRLIRFHNLTPTAPSESVTSWPWPVKIRLFGKFSLEIDEKRVAFKSKAKAQQKPLELLKCLLAKGGRDISAAYLQDTLWPESDGDRAVYSYKAALHRLRRLLENTQALCARTERLSLNEKLCWTDLWAFEDLSRKVEARLLEDDSKFDAKQWLHYLLNIYQGPFLADEEAHWVITVRRNLAAGFSNLIQRLTLRLAQRDEMETAVALLQRAILAAPADNALRCLLETFGKTAPKMTQ